MSEIVLKTSTFKWNKKRGNAALMLAQGYTQAEVAEEAGVADRTVRRWMAHHEFKAEVNRLSLMTGIANRAERLRMAMRVVRSLDNETDKDLLDWLKFAQAETDGVKLDLTSLADAFGLLAGSGSEGVAGKKED